MSRVGVLVPLYNHESASEALEDYCPLEATPTRPLPIGKQMAVAQTRSSCLQLVGVCFCFMVKPSRTWLL